MKSTILRAKKKVVLCKAAHVEKKKAEKGTKNNVTGLLVAFDGVSIQAVSFPLHTSVISVNFQGCTHKRQRA